jgi:FtsP/CotA-like multicopper oxidase with cupredoxin domain
MAAINRGRANMHNDRSNGTGIDRRRFLAGAAAGIAVAAMPRSGRSAVDPLNAFDLSPAPADVAIAGADYPKTAVFAFNGQVPAPVLRVKRGERLRVAVRNGLDQGTTVHWHGIRLANPMDGVPFLTQPPIGPGETFVYEFDAKDAGTFWYHPHANSAVQVGRGLYGALIVEEDVPVEVDREILWVLDDWRLQEDAQVAPFGNWHDLSHAGRIGNTVTINGKVPETFPVTSGERIRLRLVNAANARVFGLEFRGHAPWLVAVDGHPVAPKPITGGPVVIAPGARADLVIDMTGKPGESFDIIDGYYRRFAYKLADLAYGADEPARSETLAAPRRLPANPVAEPVLDRAKRFDMTFAGGAMGGMTGATLRGRAMTMRQLAEKGMFWAIDGVAIPNMEKGDPGAPLLTLERGSSAMLRWRNDTAFDHPIHLHGHAFHVVSRNGQPFAHPVIRDTVLIPPQQHVDVAFIADNPGDWMLHCHILEHQQSGMMGYIRVGS